MVSPGPAGSVPPDTEFLRRARPAIATAMIVFAAGVGLACGLFHACNRGPFTIKEFFSGGFITGVDAFALALLVFVAAVNLREAGSASEVRRYRLLRDLTLPAGSPSHDPQAKPLVAALAVDDRAHAPDSVISLEQ